MQYDHQLYQWLRHEGVWMFTNGIVARGISKLDRLLSQCLEWKEKAVIELLLNMLHSEFRTVYFPIERF
jgi:hypothetical protein